MFYMPKVKEVIYSFKSKIIKCPDWSCIQYERLRFSLKLLLKEDYFSKHIKSVLNNLVNFFKEVRLSMMNIAKTRFENREGIGV